jgi:hypothetical protein
MKRPPAYKLSFCIICMNRLSQLQETLFKNLTDNATYLDLEFILLDYNSQDGMEAWAMQHLQKYIRDGRLVYYKTNEPQEFNHSHAKDLAFKLANGDIICNINADHFTGENFAGFVNELFQKEGDIILTPIRAFASEKNTTPKDVFGKVCMRREHFNLIRGFDERMVTYGFEDFDMINRAEMAGVRRYILSDPRFLKFISHDDDRSMIGNTYEKPERIFVRHINFFSSDILVLFNSGLAEIGTMIDESVKYADDIQSAIQQQQYRFEYTLTNAEWLCGWWTEDQFKELKISTGSNFRTIKLDQTGRIEIASEYMNEQPFFLLEDKQSIEELMEFKYLFKNRRLLENNILTRNIRPNPESFGKATVYKNFNYNLPIAID